jgi:hypothetical protein
MFNNTVTSCQTNWLSITTNINVPFMTAVHFCAVGSLTFQGNDFQSITYQVIGMDSTNTTATPR